MIVRALDTDGDWEFGAGLNSYKFNNLAIAQNIKTRLSSFIGDCFFDMGAGVNWLYYLGSKDVLGLRLAISAVVINTTGVVGIRLLNLTLTPGNRRFSISYQVQTVDSVTGGSFIYDLGGGVSG